ncbi:MAG: hypothetical protein DCC75_06275 [Proteobacteria bacterium]|nr:MAG: hypothetical protein DCC75_06275 [Pseudomonadota bacterium]
MSAAAILVISTLLSGWLVPLFLAGCTLLLLGAALELGSFQIGLTLALFFAPVFTAYLIGMLLDREVEAESWRGLNLPLGPAGALLSFLIVLETLGAGSALRELTVISELESSRASAGTALLLNKSFMSASMAAIILMSLVALFEMISRWIGRATSAKVAIPYSALRLVLVILLISIGFDLIVGLVSHELKPITILGR